MQNFGNSTYTNDGITPSQTAVLPDPPTSSDIVTLIAFLGGGLVLGLFVFSGKTEAKEETPLS